MWVWLKKKKLVNLYLGGWGSLKSIDFEENMISYVCHKFIKVQNYSKERENIWSCVVLNTKEFYELFWQINLVKKRIKVESYFLKKFLPFLCLSLNKMLQTSNTVDRIYRNLLSYLSSKDIISFQNFTLGLYIHFFCINKNLKYNSFDQLFLY